MLADALRDAPYREQLETLRDWLADALDHAPPREQAPIALQLRATLADLAALPARREVSILDDLRDRRASRRADASARTSA
jgi:hypothetical protein